MRIVTFNCNSVRSRLPIILDWLAANEPDVLALQETKVTDEQFPVDAFTQAGWQASFCGQKSYNGVAMITRETPDAITFGLGDDEGESRPRLALMQLGDLHVLNTYVPQGRSFESEMFAFKLEWFARLRTFLDARLDPTRDKLVWVGDLNIAPEPMDVHDHKRIWPHVCHCQETTDVYREWLHWGLVDVFRKHLPEPGTFTYWDYRVRNALDRNVGWRIDHVLATPAMAATSRDVFVDTEPRRPASDPDSTQKPSDHTFVVADFA